MDAEGRHHGLCSDQTNKAEFEEVRSLGRYVSVCYLHVHGIVVVCMFT